MVAQKYNQAKLPLSRKRKVLIGAVIVIVIGVVLRMAGPIAQKTDSTSHAGQRSRGGTGGRVCRY